MIKNKQTLIEKSSIRILIAENDDMYHMILKVMLKEYQQERAISGQEVLDKVRDNYFDLVLMDVHRPETNGLEATREIREFNKEIPIIILTTDMYAVHYTKAIEAGCNEYIAKPFAEKELMKVIDRIVTEKVCKSAVQPSVI